MATIQKTRYGTYQACVRRKGHRTIVKTFKEHKLALQWARSVETKMDAGVFQDLKTAEDTTLRDLLTRYEREILPQKNSQQQVRSVIGLLKRDLRVPRQATQAGIRPDSKARPICVVSRLQCGDSGLGYCSAKQQ